MNEIFLLLLIAFTCVTFISLNKRVGSTGPHQVQLPAMLQAAKNDAHLTSVLYSGLLKKQTSFNRFWAINASADLLTGASTGNHNAIRIVYHQSVNLEKLLPYESSRHDSEHTYAENNAEQPDEVCVVSSISDTQYHHLLVALDTVA